MKATGYICEDKADWYMDTIRMLRRDSIRALENIEKHNWSYLKDNGYRCIKVDLTIDVSYKSVP